MIRAAASASVALIVIVAFGLIIHLKTTAIPQTSQYVGSATCEGCHRAQHATWRVSQHTKIMRRPETPGVVVADFMAEGTPFSEQQVIWVIGGKWEQQFMGQDETGETLLPGAWHRATESWQVTGWDGWNAPIPKLRCHGCHTVGLDPTTGTFVEPDIGCESCHGPAGWHVGTFGLGRIVSLADAEVCGQCHTRGRGIGGDTYFPVAYRPGEPLDEKFTHEAPSIGQNSSDYWGDGRSRNRHQQFIDWRTSGHVDSLPVLREGYDGRYGEVEDDCLRCHSGDYILATETKPDVAQARDGVTCSVCHNVHGELDRPRMVCADCHAGGAFYHEPERNGGHVPCPDSISVTCVDCHMPRTVLIGGGFQAHSHSPGISQPIDAEKWSNPSSCKQGDCHPTASLADLQESFDRHYRRGTAER